jgi:hypothetical protein
MKWEYKKIALNETRHREDALDLLLDAGKNGWELVTLTANNVAYFKRPSEERKQAEAQPPLQPEPQREQLAPSLATPGEHVAKYRDPITGDTWSGRGRMPNWLKRKLGGGDTLGKYLAG